MSSLSIKIRAIVQMQSKEKLPVVKPFLAGWGPELSFHGKLFPAKVLECDPPIPPGSFGEATIGVVAQNAEDLVLEKGSMFEILSGGRLIATATVASLQYES